MNQDNNENIQNESMVLYRGIYEAIKEYPPRSKADALYAILDYGFYGIIPQSKNYNVISAFNFSKPVIDKAKKRYKSRVENGRKGGAPRGNINALKKITYSQETTENNLKTTENNLNDNVNDNDNDNYNVNDNDTVNENDDVNVNESVYVNDNIKKEPDKAGSNTLPVGEYNNVFLSATEKAKLIIELGYDGYEKSVDCLSRYIKRKPGFNSACHFEDLRGWVQDHMRKNGVYHTAEAEEKLRKAIEAGFDFEFEDIFEKP